MAGIVGASIIVSDAKRVIHEVVSTLQDNTERQRFGGAVSQIAISEVFKGGSMGKGTTVPGEFDVDLIIFSRSLELSDATDITSYKGIMTEYDRYLRTRLRDRYIKKGINDHSLQFKYHNIKVDLLLSPYFNTKQEYYRFLETIDRDKISLFSCSASKWQVEFVQSYPNIVLEYIKRAKAWRNNSWGNDESGRPSSYLMEILVIKAYENGGRIDSPQIIKQQMVSLVSNKRIAVYWTNNYSTNEIWKFNSRNPPYIIDPANPSNNLYISGITKGQTYYADGDWTKIRQRINSLNLSERGY